MKSHFSILSAVLRPEIQEQITIGLFLINEKKVFFNSSKNKLSIVKQLISSSSYKYLKDIIEQITSASDIENKSFQGLFNSSKKIKKPFSYSYLEYLSKYNNNLLTFSTPKQIDLPSNQELFKILFNKYVDDKSLIENITKSNKFDKFKNEFCPRVKSFFNIEQEVTKELLPDLLMPIKVDLIGKNEIPVFAHSIDLERQNYHIQNDISTLLMLNNSFEKSKGFFVSSEPDKKKYSKQHDIWNNIRKSKENEYIDISEYQKIKEYAKKHGVRPIIQN